MVGARKAKRELGNQRLRLYMTTEAISVLPIPVGSETSVLCSSAQRAIECW